MAPASSLRTTRLTGTLQACSDGLYPPLRRRLSSQDVIRPANSPETIFPVSWSWIWAPAGLHPAGRFVMSPIVLAAIGTVSGVAVTSVRAGNGLMFGGNGERESVGHGPIAPGRVNRLRSWASSYGKPLAENMSARQLVVVSAASQPVRAPV